MYKHIKSKQHRLWTAVRTYQATATTIPTDVEFKAVLDGVVF